MARREPVRLPRVRLATARPPRAGLPAAGWEQPRPAKTTGGGGTDPGAMEAAIMEALVLWYDLKKQGATNESMAENPVLRDLSGNGHDATCYNFAWSSMSGIGGFQISGSRLSPDGIFVVPSNSYANTAASNMTDKDVIVTFEVTGNEGKWLKAKNVLGTGGEIIMETNGIFSLTLSAKSHITFYTTNAPTEDNVYPGGQTVRFIPLYPNALVTDGVDDLCWVEQLEALTDFTVMAEREFIRFDQYGGLAYKWPPGTGGNGAFIFEMNYNKGEAVQPDECWVFSNDGGGGNNDITPVQGRVSWMTPASYNGQPLTRGERTDGRRLDLFCNKGNITQTCSAALWSFILFRRTLTAEEIEWVKNNLIEAKQ